LLQVGASLRERSGSTPRNFRKIPDLSASRSGKWPFWAQKRRNSRKTGHFSPLSSGIFRINLQILRDLSGLTSENFRKITKIFTFLKKPTKIAPLGGQGSGLVVTGWSNLTGPHSGVYPGSIRALPGVQIGPSLHRVGSGWSNWTIPEGLFTVVINPEGGIDNVGRSTK
jgi:hypothetical protein